MFHMFKTICFKRFGQKTQDLKNMIVSTFSKNVGSQIFGFGEVFKGPGRFKSFERLVGKVLHLYRVKTTSK